MNLEKKNLMVICGAQNNLHVKLFSYCGHTFIFPIFFTVEIKGNLLCPLSNKQSFILALKKLGKSMFDHNSEGLNRQII